MSGAQTSEEACLSVMGKSGIVERPMKITVHALNRRGEAFEVTADGLLARVFCHEIDHLNGILFTDIATEIKYKDEDD
jgi:peptide deformylase